MLFEVKIKCLPAVWMMEYTGIPRASNCGRATGLAFWWLCTGCSISIAITDLQDWSLMGQQSLLLLLWMPQSYLKPLCRSGALSSGQASLIASALGCWFSCRWGKLVPSPLTLFWADFQQSSRWVRFTLWIFLRSFQLCHCAFDWSACEHLVIKLATVLSALELSCINNSLVFCLSQQVTASWLVHLVGVGAIQTEQNFNVPIEYI